jgi:hypothetical protein
MPMGPVLTITKVYTAEPFSIYRLLDGRTEFECNLHPVPLDGGFSASVNERLVG